MIRICEVCRKEFIQNPRCNHEVQRFCSRKCKDKQKRKVYYTTERYLKNQNWARENSLMVDGKRQIVRKRPFIGFCELCGRELIPNAHNFAWHHWNDQHPEWGMWLCYKCHIQVAESVEYDPTGKLRKKYKDLKKELSQ